MKIEDELALASAALAAIGKIWSLVANAKAGHITMAEAQGKIAELHSRIDADRAAIDAAAATKFDVGGGT